MAPLSFKNLALMGLVSAAGMVLGGSPLKTRSGTPNDIDIANIALTLEFLESTFYATYLGMYDDKAFANAAFQPWVRERISQISQHESQHVQLLNSTIIAAGATPVQACSYQFPVTDVLSFVAVASVLEAVGTGAYLGAAPLVSSKAVLAAAGSILTTEARHQAWLNSAALKANPWSGPEETAITLSQAYSAAAQFITACPASNPALPVTLFETLAIAADGTVTYKGQQDGQYILIMEGLDSKTFVIQGGKISLPQIQGFAYAVATSQQDPTKITDSNTLAGPKIFNNAFLAKESNPAPSFKRSASSLGEI